MKNNAQDLIDEVESDFRYSTLPKAEKQMIEKIAWGDGIEIKHKGKE